MQSEVSESSPELLWSFPLLGKTYRNSFGTFPGRGRLVSISGEQSPIGESLPELFWEIPQVGTLYFRFFINWSHEFLIYYV